MADVFISYARSTERAARAIGEALRALGYGVWRDDEIPAHRAYADVIRERLAAARAVVVVWSAEAAKSEWVQSEADRARAERKLVQLTIDGAELPMPFDRLQCADMNGWAGEADHPGWRKVVESVAALAGSASPAPPVARKAAAPAPRKVAICVMPFTNMSGDPEQEYFSDGVCEDIITDLSKVSALNVTARNTAFAYKGKSVDLRQAARELNVSHVLEGSVRKAGSRVRVTAQLIDGASGNHLWAERYDHDMTDIFALQDEISQAVVAALKLRLLPEEKRAIERRGTDNVEAYDLYLMARQYFVTGNDGDPRREEAIIRLCRQAVELDPGFAAAWTLIGFAQLGLRFRHGRTGIDSWAAVERSLALDPDLADAHALKALHRIYEDNMDETVAASEIALRLDPESYQANRIAAVIASRQRRHRDAVPLWAKTSAVMEGDIFGPAMLMSSHTALDEEEAARAAARMCVTRAETVLAHDRSNGSALALGAGALAVLGEVDRARDWARRAMLIDPDNLTMRYNLACALAAQLHDREGALELLAPYFAWAPDRNDLTHARVDPDLDAVRDDPRFQAMLADAEARLGA